MRAPLLLRETGEGGTQPEASLLETTWTAQRARGPEPCRPRRNGASLSAGAELLSAWPLSPAGMPGGRGALGRSRQKGHWLREEPTDRGLRGGTCTCRRLFLFFAPPSNWGSLVQMIPQDTALDSGGPIRSGWVQANHGKKPPPAFLPWASAAKNIYIAISIYLRSGI